MNTQRIRHLRAGLIQISNNETAHPATTAGKYIQRDNEAAKEDRLKILNEMEEGPAPSPLAEALDILSRILRLPSRELEVVRDIMRCVDRLQPEEPQRDLAAMIYGSPDEHDPKRTVCGADIIAAGGADA